VLLLICPSASVSKNLGFIISVNIYFLQFKRRIV
jgi:hypothetical protein